MDSFQVATSSGKSALNHSQTEQIEPKYFVALIAGIVAAAAGGLVWSMIASSTGYEFGILAWGIGWLCGYSVVLFSGGQKCVSLQVISISSAIFGIALGKYFTFASLVRTSIEKDYGQEAVAKMSLLSEPFLQLFLERISTMLNIYDALWILMAILTAMRVARD